MIAGKQSLVEMGLSVGYTYAPISLWLAATFRLCIIARRKAKKLP